MGLSSFFGNFRKPKGREIPLQPIAGWENSATGVAYPATSRDDRYDRRPQSAHESKSRRMSWFGRAVPSDEEVPDMPKSSFARLDEPIRPSTAVSTHAPGKFDPSSYADASHEKRKSRRMSISRALSRKRSAPNLSHSNGEFDIAPPVPAMPARATKAPTTAQTPTAKQLAGTASQNRRVSRRMSTVSLSKRLSRGIWTSSNPEDSDDSDVPPMPTLVRSNTTTPDSQHEDDSDADTAKPRVSDAASVRTTRAYRPKSAGRGFLLTASPVSNAQRKSYRQSIGISDDEPMVCLNEEQAKKWERLKELVNMMDLKAPDKANAAASAAERSTYANDDALAALSGVAR